MFKKGKIPRGARAGLDVLDIYKSNSEENKVNLDMTIYTEFRVKLNEETGEMDMKSAWLVIKLDATNELILSQDISDNLELLEIIKAQNIS